MSATLLWDQSTQTWRQEPAEAPAQRTDDQSQRAQRLESIGMLASGIAHDLNNVLSPIIVAAPLLKEHATTPENLRLINSLEKSAERGVELVRQILSFAHGAGTVQQRLHVADLLNESVTLAKGTFPKSVTVIPEIPTNLWPIMADPTQIHQILLNLCVNARDAMAAGGTLTVGAENCLLDQVSAGKIEGGRPGPWTVIYVEDTGTGISQDSLAKIWDPFFTTKGCKGTGLGLSTVRGIVSSHNGFVTLKTQLGSGTTFRIYLPAAEEQVQPVTSAQGRPSVKRGNGELVMVVDDEPQIREMTSAMLTRNGYRVLTAGDGTEAVALFATRRNEISVVVTDLAIPHMDGVALTRVVQNLNPRVKVLTMSGLASAGRVGSLKPYTGAFLYKPFKVQALLEEVHKLIHPSLMAVSA
ncbi:MAG TPA: ATP-binding protein [Opitutaceae bacterium]|jgi:nitrogen-specific signal transduction histidine kinase/ActR/RegA family two-component response regulator|nr:ATP-binding protein [Opitutaceae bacterium]